MLRIVHVCPLYTPVIGGVEQCLSRLGDRLAARGDEVEVWTTTAASVQGLTRPEAATLPEGEETQSSGVRVRRYPVRHLPAHRYVMTAAQALPFGEDWRAHTLRWSPLAPALRRAARAEGPALDVVLGGPLPFTSLLHAAWRLARTRRAAFVAAPFTHLGRPGREADRIRRIYLSPLNVALLRRADRVLVQTGAERDALAAAGVEADRLVIGGAGVDPSTCAGGRRDRGRARWGLAADAMVIGHLANKSWDKGTVDLLDAAEGLWQRGLRFQLLLAGQEMPTFARRWAAFAAGPYRDRVVNLGRLDAEEKQDFFAAIDLFALPSYVESFGISLLEAAVNGTPSVAYALGGPAELFRDDVSARLAPAGDRAALMEAIAGLIDSAPRGAQARARLGAEARRVAAAHDWNASLARVVAMYDEVGGRR